MGQSAAVTRKTKTRRKPRPRVKRAGIRPRARLPGDLPLAALVRRMIRVDHAGEFGAVRIYEGQISVLGAAPAGAVIRRMAAQEREHLKSFERLMLERRARPSALLPLWRIAGFALGAGTALLGPEAAMACTVAVEEVIDRHYARQVEELGADEPELARAFARFRAEECAHRDTALGHGAEQAPAYAPLTAAIRAGARAAIWLSERI
ncbi:MAG: demethoxyubiquinone hydroxylase family protein [Rhodospirillales bacterium]|nr:demethoxyubiquinone hydroxylase family protein [Rhodospirillales bacterium]MSP80686.1 demethoxyubiquinone hydroxylase family protein [Rhodospirillales bacterium]